MRFTERELTEAIAHAAKQVLAIQDKSVRRGRRDVEEAWQELGGYGRFTLLDGIGDQVLPVLVSLPDVEVAPGTRPTFTDEQVRAAVDERLDDGLGAMRRRALLEARVALVHSALAGVPPRQDPDALVVPDHL